MVQVCSQTSLCDYVYKLGPLAGLVLSLASPQASHAASSDTVQTGGASDASAGPSASCECALAWGSGRSAMAIASTPALARGSDRTARTMARRIFTLYLREGLPDEREDRYAFTSIPHWSVILSSELRLSSRLAAFTGHQLFLPCYPFPDLFLVWIQTTNIAVQVEKISFSLSLIAACVDIIKTCHKHDAPVTWHN